VVAVAWRPGDEHAGVVVLAGGDVAVGLLAEALRRGQAALLQQMERTAMQAREEATQLRRRLEEGG